MSNAIARPVRILVGGVDFSDSFLSYSGARSTADTSGLLSVSGQIELHWVPGKTPESLDDRSNPQRWHRGQQITLEIGNEAGGWDRFPHGALRIIEAEFNGRGLLKLSVGDLIAYGSFKEATDYRDANLNPPTYRTAEAIALDLLEKLEIAPANADLSAMAPLRINYPIQLSDNYWRTIGQLAWSAGCYVWCDRFEIIRTATMTSEPGSADLAVQVGASEINYRRLAGAQKPPEKVIVTGTRNLVDEPKATTTTIEEQYGPAYFLGENDTSITIIKRTKITDQWLPSQNKRRITTVEEEPPRLITNDSQVGSMVVGLQKVEEYIYEVEGDGSDDKGKLLRIESNSEAPRIKAFTSYSDGWVNAPYELVDYESVLSEFQYSDDEQVLEQQTITASETAANIFRALNWSSTAVDPGDLYPSRQTITEWKERIPEFEWEEITTVRLATEVAARDGVAITDGVPIRQRLALTTTGTSRRRSNNGARPPAPDRRPPAYSVIRKAYRKEVLLPQPGASYRARPITLRIPFLPGERLLSRRGSVSVNFQPTSDWGTRLGQLFGALLIGRFKGADLELPYRDALKDLTPLSVVDVTEPLFEGGTITRSFLVDGDAYVLTPQENRGGFDLIWAGDRTGITQSVSVPLADGSTQTLTVELTAPPYAQAQSVAAYGASYSAWGTKPYGAGGPQSAAMLYGCGYSTWT